MSIATASTRAARARDELGSLPQRIASLKAMTMRELREVWAEVFGYATASHNHAYLRKKIAWRLQEIAEGGLSARAREQIAVLGHDAPVRHRPLSLVPVAPAATRTTAAPRDPRLPPVGTVLRRVHNGVEHQVTVLDDGFTYQGARYRSLSTIAKRVTGTTWNGLVFFGLASRCAAKNAR